MAIKLQCEKPISIKSRPFEQFACRQCYACLKRRKLEWSNRMMLESWQLPYKPLFTTFTFAQEHYLDNPKYVLYETQKLFKRIRRHGVDLRYFMAIERGDRNGRLHNHAILWSKSLYTMDFVSRWRFLYDRWGRGAVSCSVVRHKGSLFYTAKYISKNLATLDELDDVRNIDKATGMAKLQGRTYTWSNKPALGTRGIDRWKELVLKSHGDNPYHKDMLPSNKLKMMFNGKFETTYIPKDTYCNYVRDVLKIDIAPEPIQIYKQTGVEPVWLGIPEDINQPRDGILERMSKEEITI